MRFATFLWWLTTRRTRASWRLLFASFVAVVLSTVVVSATVLYASTLAARGLEHAMANVPAAGFNIQVIAQERPLGRAEYDKLQTAVEHSIDTRFSGLLRAEERYGRIASSGLFEPSRSRPGLQGYTYFLTHFEEHSLLVDGHWPAPSPVHLADGREAYEVSIGQQVARQLQWSPGFVLALRPASAEPSATLLLVVSSVAIPKDPAEEYWMGDTSIFTVQQSDAGQWIPIYIQEEAFWGGLGARFPGAPGDFWWRVFINPFAINPSTVNQTLDALRGLETDVNKVFPRSLVLSLLGPELKEYQRRLALAQVPIYLFAALVVGVLLYYLWMVSSLLARSRGPEVALLRSRGASLLQIVGIMGLSEGLLLATPAVLAGPLLALGLMRCPVTAALFHSGSNSTIAAGVTVESYTLSALVGVLAIAVLMLSSLTVATGGVMEFHRARSRPSSVMAFHRYYLDVFLLLIVGFVWWQLRNRGGFITSRVLGEGIDVSPVTLLGPALGLYAGGLILLRLFPVMVRMLAKLAEMSGPPWLVHGLRRVARDANLYGALTLLLTLAVSLGIFGAVFSATLQETRRAQAAYRIGGEVVVRMPFSLGDRFEKTRSSIENMPGVSAVSVLRRAQGSLVKGGPQSAVNVLAVDPRSLGDTAWFRKDFAAKGIDELLDPLAVPVSPGAGIPLPTGTNRIGVWMRPNKAFPGLNVWLHLTGAGGELSTVFLGELDVPSWRFFQTELPVGSAAPARVLGFVLTTGFRGSIGAGDLLLDDLTAIDTTGNSRVVETFDQPGQWQTLPHRGAAADTVSVAATGRARSGGALQYMWTAPYGADMRGFLAPVVSLPIPAIGSAPYKKDEDLMVWVGNVLIPVRIVDTASYFPTLDTTRSPFLILNIEHYLQYRQVLPFSGGDYADELWIGLEPGTDSEQVATALRKIVPSYATVVDRETEAQIAQDDPLTAGGWGSLVLLSMIALIGAMVLGFSLFAALSIQSGKVELAVLETLGFSRRHIFLLVTLEFLLVCVTGILSGFVIGLWVGRWTLGYLVTQGFTSSSLPPLVLSLDGPLSTLAILGTALATGIATALALAAIWRAQASEVLRGE
ncbi:MAG: ABC transporter permease [Dehalococcoidia bacterium]|nr:ABC transporter permease [Dehalococcoidia bacterium]